MIIFYEKDTGKIVGTIDGRIHSEEHLKMWVGSKKENGRLVIQWKPVKIYKDKAGNLIGADYEPDHSQKDIFSKIENNTVLIYDYKINLRTKELEKCNKIK